MSRTLLISAVSNTNNMPARLPPTTLSIIVRKLGLQPYQTVWKAMRTFTDQRTPDTLDQLWFLEHEAVFTQGKIGKMIHLHDRGNIPLVQSDRGGQITYHGPGQLILYWLIDLSRRKMRVRQLIDAIERSAIQALLQLGIIAHARLEAPGIYVDAHKIGSLGVRICRGCSFHGLALNVNMDLRPFLRINPCGYPGLQMVQISKWLPTITPDVLQPILLQQALRQLGNPSIHAISRDLPA